VASAAALSEWNEDNRRRRRRAGRGRSVLGQCNNSGAGRGRSVLRHPRSTV